MIWVNGEIVADDALRISVLDRTFEHGLGLFETFRTWNGHATLLDRHMARLRSSAEALGLPLDPAHLPDPGAIAALLAADGRAGDSMIRITMSGGMTSPGTAAVWMRAFPLPGDTLLGAGSDDKRSLDIASPALDPDWKSPLGRHKTLNYWRRQLEFEQRGRESAIMAGDGNLIEGTRTNLFYVAGETLKTAGLTYPILPGIMRGLVLERARVLGFKVEEIHPHGPGKRFEPDKPEWTRADEMFLTNSVRGIVPVPSVTSGKTFPAPGPLTEKLLKNVREWLERGGGTP